VTVVIDAVKIISDGDPDPPRPLPPDCGEISLWLWANYQQPSAKFISVPNSAAEISERAAIISMTSSANSHSGMLPIFSGYLSAHATMIEVITKEPTCLVHFEPAPVEKPRDTGDEELNGASGEFNLTKIVAGEIKRFTLVSTTAHGGGRGDLMFEVYGYIKISYPQR